jgi:transcriptional regulator with XRE-family HTH domain
MATSIDSDAHSVVAVIGRQLKKHRQRLGITQVALAERCGIYRTYLSRIENGTANPTVLVVEALANALQLEIYDLIRE